MESKLFTRWFASWLVAGTLMLGLGIYVKAQTVTSPKLAAAVCVYNSSPPTGSSGTFILVQCDSTGKLKIK